MNPLLKLLADNRGRGQFRAEAEGEEATLYLYDVIVADDFWGGVGAETFVRELNALNNPVIHLRINSPGGDVFAARAMEQAIREHSSQIITHVDGYAASAASWVALAGDKKLIGPGGFYMVHKGWTVAVGNADELTDTVGLLNKVDRTLVKTYAKRTGQSEEQLMAWLAATTWFDADESVEHGFADEIIDPPEKVASAMSQWDMAAYARPPEITPDPEPEPEPEPEAPAEPVAAYDSKHTDHLQRCLRLVSSAA